MHAGPGGQSVRYDVYSRAMADPEPTLNDVLRELRALRAENDTRFDAIDRRFDAVDHRIDALSAENDRRFDAVDRRFDAVDHRIDAVDRRIDAVDRRIDALSAENDTRFDAIDRRIDALSADLETLGRETRRGWETLRTELLAELPAAAAAAVDRALGARVRDLERDVAELKRAVG